MTEIMIASAILILVVGGVLAALIQALWTWQKQEIIAELNMDLENAVERIRMDLRLSSVGLGLMSFYPQDAAYYTAISLPLSDDLNDDGLLDRDTTSGKITWNRTVIYHVRPGHPDELLRTEFAPRFTNATPQMLYQQLSNVVAAANASQIQAAALDGEEGSSRVVFQNLVDLRFYPPDMRYDCYAPVAEKGRTFNWGSLVLGAGNHLLRFKVEGKNAASSGHRVIVDRIRMSYVASDREGEIFTPVNSHPVAPYYAFSASGGTIQARQMGGSWMYSGNAAMEWGSTGVGSTLTFNLYNDLWCDSNFQSPGPVLSSNCSVKFDYTFTNSTPYIPDMVVSMDKGIAWTANSISDSSSNLLFSGTAVAVTNLIYAGTNGPAATTLNGEWARFSFTAGLGAPLFITNAAVRDVATAAAGTILFNGGRASAWIPAGSNLWSDWVPNYSIVREHAYEVAFKIGGLGDKDYDLVIGDSAGRLNYYRNRGTPTAPAWAANVPFWQSIDYGSYSAPSFADIDGDGDPDLFIGGWFTGNIQFYRNRGTPQVPSFALENADWNAIRTPLSRPVFTDIDGDGDLDFFAGGQNGYIVFCRNTGTRTAPQWASVDTQWKNLRVLRNNNASEEYHYSAPAFEDIDGDGDQDLFVGRYEPGDLTLFRNTGSRTNATFAAGVQGYGGFNVGWFSTPCFVDIDGDSDRDCFVGNYEGNVTFFRNTGTVTAPAWGETNNVYNGIDIGGYSTPTFVNIDPDRNSAASEVNDAWVMSYTNRVASHHVVALAQIEVGYPPVALFRSGILDTRLAAPQFRQLNWTQVENAGIGGDVDVRVRSSDEPDLSDLTDADWMDANPSDQGFFQSNSGNSLATLPRRRYVQYECMLRCYKAGAHTNAPSAILRDVTIDWPGPNGLVDLQVDFGKGPNCGIVSATVDGQPLNKGVTIEMEIFKSGRTGTNSVRGIMEVRPLNTGK